MKRKKERRADPRLRKLMRVYVADPADALDEVFTGWVVDRSAGGVCLSFPRSEVEEGNILMVQPISPMANLPWIEVQVKHRRQKASRVELGCAFVHRAGWERILLVD
jgi:hypothetical protein